MEKHKQDSESTGGRNPTSGGPVMPTLTDEQIEDRLYWIQNALVAYSTRTNPARYVYNAVESIVRNGPPEIKEMDNDEEKTEESGKIPTGGIKVDDIPGTGFGEQLLKEYQKRFGQT